MKLVSSKPKPEPPYPADTHVRGWKFILDHERLFVSDTWALAQPDMRPWLLMVWVTAWTQRPAGSFPNNDGIISAKIGMDHRLFAAHKDILLRGWVEHNDGLIYHPVIVEQVQRFQQHNRKEAARVAKWRESKQQSNASVTRNKHVSTTPEPEPEPDIRDMSNDISCRQKLSVDANLPVCPHKKIIALYHEQLPMLRKVRTWTGERPKILGRLWKQHPDLDWFAGYFAYVAESEFLTGKASDFQADLEWLLRPRNFQKINEGKYHGTRKAP